MIPTDSGPRPSPIQWSRVLAGLLVLLLMGARDGGAQEIPSHYRFIEGRFAVDVLGGVQTANNGDLNLGPKDGPMAALRWNAILGGPFMFEAGVAYVPTTRDVQDPLQAEENRRVGEADVDLLKLTADLRFSLTGDRTWRGLFPYVTVGGGWMWDLAGEQPDDLLVLERDQRFRFGNSFLARLGGGSTLVLTRHLQLRADAVFELYKVETPGGWRELEDDLGPIPEDQWVNGLGLTLGLGWRF